MDIRSALSAEQKKRVSTNEIETFTLISAFQRLSEDAKPISSIISPCFYAFDRSLVSSSGNWKCAG